MAVLHAKSVTIADMTGTVTVFGSGGATETIAATNLVRPSDFNSGHNQLYTLSGNTTNASTASGTNVVYEARGDITLGGSTGTLVVAAGIGQNNEQWIGTGVRPFAAQTSTSLGQNSLYITPVILERAMSVVALKLPAMITNSSSAVSSGQKGVTFIVGAYSRVETNVTATGYTQLTRVWSSSHTIAASYSSNVSSAHSAISAIGNSTSYNSYSSSSAGANVSSILHGPRELIFPVSSTYAPGEYWMGVAQSTSGAGTVGNVLNISNVIATVQTYNRVGIGTNATNPGIFRELMAGTYSATTGALPATINQTQINQAGTYVLGFLGQATQ
jgi:hypothetical protein